MHAGAVQKGWVEKTKVALISSAYCRLATPLSYARKINVLTQQFNIGPTWCVCVRARMEHLLVDGEAAEDVVRRLRETADEKGLEVYPFKVGWYNARVEKPYHLQLHEDTLAVLIVSTPSMFEKLFLPFVMGEQFTAGTTDPLDRCIGDEMTSTATKLFPLYKVEFIQDSDLLPSRRPKVLVQTAGHVSGAAYYYQRSDVAPQPWSEDVRIYGVCVHPRHGGWFALRGVLLFHGLLVPSLVQRAPVDCVSSREGRVELLEKFNINWQDWRYKDVMESGVIVERFSETQKMYFATEPRDRFDLIQRWRQERGVSSGN